MKLENCGRCGLGPIRMKALPILDKNGVAFNYTETYGCPVHDANEERGKLPDQWNAAQFAARTERINAAAVAIHAPRPGEAQAGSTPSETAIAFAEALIDAQDAATRVRWAKTQGDTE